MPLTEQGEEQRALLTAFRRVLSGLGRAAHRGEEWPPGRLTMPQFRVLLAIARPWRFSEPPGIPGTPPNGHEPDRGPDTIGSLARRLGLSAPTVTGIIDRLSESGYVQRRRPETDRRRVEVVPTQAGLNLVRELFAAHDERLAGHLSALDRAEAEALLKGLEALARVLEAEVGGSRSGPGR